ncbi:hypothetical protein EOM27_00695 [Candidatus Saccharibacteria bacterium]|jgi:hypothetical protein|nr:hypothetical protein [Candidatus Saccharibacteria bacterium]NCU43472.1 hypothetical protein [Candidatus Saccharibacteria bacterium]
MKKILTNIAKIGVFVPAFALLAGLAVPVATTYANNCDVSGGITGGKDCARNDEQPENLFNGDGSVFQTVTNVMLFLIGAISVVMLIYGGIRYTISQGDSTAVTNAKNTIMYAVIGIVIAILAFAIVNFVVTTFVA